jgi:hypothetical protein
MEFQMKPTLDEDQLLLNFSDPTKPPQSFKLKNTNYVLYIDYEDCHHVTYDDFNTYTIKRKNKPSKVVMYDSHIQRYQAFIKMGFLV